MKSAKPNFLWLAVHAARKYRDFHIFISRQPTSYTSDWREMVLGVLVFSFKGADESEESKCAGSPKEETRHGQTAEEGAVAEHRGRPDNDALLNFGEKLLEKTFVLKTEVRIHSSEVREELICSLPKGKDRVNRFSRVLMQRRRYSENVSTAPLCSADESTCRRIIHNIS